MLLAVLSIFLAGGCSADKDLWTGSQPGPGTEEEVPVKVSFRVTISEGNVVGTRGIDLSDESGVDEIDALVFDESGRFLYRATTGNLQAPLFGMNFREFEVDLFSASLPRTIHFLANCSAAVDALEPTITKGDSEESVLSRIESGVAPAGAGMMLPFTMWGRKTFNEIPATGIPLTENRQFSLLRSVARVDVGVNNTAPPGNTTAAWAGLADFTISSVRLYNAPERGRVAPVLTSLSATGTKVTGVSVPSSVPGLTHYNTVGIPENPGENFIERSFYVYERTGGISWEPGSPTGDDCLTLVIGGYYGTQTTEETFYKVELRDGEGTLLPTLRNHTYRVNITDVTSKGHSDLATALENLPLGIRAEIEVLSPGLQNSVYDEQHHLSSDKTEMVFYREGKFISLLVETNHEDGFTIFDHPSWITVTDETGLVTYPPGYNVTEGTAVLMVTAGPHEEDIDRQPGIIALRAGRLEINVDVSQTYLPELHLGVDPISMVFYRTGNPQIGTDDFFTVAAYSVYPEKQSLKFEMVDGDWGDGTEFVTFPADVPAGQPSGVTGDYTVRPEVLATTFNKEGILRVTLITTYVTSGTVHEHSVYEEIKLTQLPQDALFIPTARNPYAPQGGTAQIYSVISELKWMSYTDPANDPPGMMSNFSDPSTTGVFNLIDNGHFDLTENNSMYNRSANILFDSADGDLSFGETKKLEIIQSGYPAVLNILSPAGGAPLEIKGDNPGPQKIEIETNTDWQFTTSYDLSPIGVFSPDKGLVVDESGNVQPNSPVRSEVIIDPVVAYPEGPGTPASQILSAPLRFQSLNYGDAAPRDITLNVNRYVPSYFRFVSLELANGGGALPDPLPRIGASVEYTVDTNAEWYDQWASENFSGKSLTRAPMEWDRYEVTMDMGPNDTWANRTVNMNTVHYDLDNGTYVSETHRQVTQRGYHVTERTEYEPWTDAMVRATLELTGAFPAMSVQAVNNSTNGSLVGGVIGSGEEATLSTTLLVPANNTWVNRDIVLQYQRNGAWRKVLPAYSQQGYFGTASTSYKLETNKKAKATFTLDGRYPSLEVRVVNADNLNQTLASGVYIGPAANVKLSKELTVPENETWADRNIIVRYNRGGSWTSVGNGWAQEGYNFTDGPKVSEFQTNSGTFEVKYKVAIGGYHPNISVQAAVSGSTTALSGSEGTVAKGTSGTRYSSELTIPINDTGSDRTVEIQYYHPNTSRWNAIKTFTQKFVIKVRGLILADLKYGTWVQADAACRAMGTGWRLPTDQEIREFTEEGYGPQISGSAPPSTQHPYQGMWNSKYSNNIPGLYSGGLTYRHQRYGETPSWKDSDRVWSDSYPERAEVFSYRCVYSY